MPTQYTSDCKMTKGILSRKLDPALQEYYDEHKIPISNLLVAPECATFQSSAVNPFLYRFIRLNPRYDAEETISMLTDELKGKEEPKPVSWLPEDSFYAIPGSFSLSASPCFQTGRIYGIDVSSGAAVSSLLSNGHDKRDSAVSTEETQCETPLRVLDLCCCPGLKLCAMADLLPSGSTVVGVDISELRMALCSKIVQKYHIDPSTKGKSEGKSNGTEVHIQLFCQDGTTFGMPGSKAYNLIFDSRVATEAEESKGERKRKNKSARGRERKRLKQIMEAELIGHVNLEGDQHATSGELASKTGTCYSETLSLDQKRSLGGMPLFDRVLVDAECSTDGSLKHLRECLKETAETPSNLLLTDKNKLSELVHLQKRLLLSGYRLLKPGGTLVYSTCSLSKDQNENVVRWLLESQGDVEIVPVEFGLAKSNLVVEGHLPGSVRFYPNLGQDPNDLVGDGFFLAKIKKRCQTTSSSKNTIT